MFVTAIFIPRCQGLRVQDVKEISPWEILEGIRNSGPLQPSWFGAVRMKRRPLRYLEQRKLVHFHTHQNTNEATSSSPYSVSLPEPSSADNYAAEGDGIPVTTPTGMPAVAVASSVEDVKPIQVTSTARSHAVGGSQPPVAPSTSVVQSQSSLPDQKREMLDKIKQEQLLRMNRDGRESHLNPVPPIMMQSPAHSQGGPGGEPMAAAGMSGSHQINQVPNPGIAPNNQAAINQALMQRQYQMAIYSMTPEQRNHLSTLTPEQRKMMMQRRIQQQQQRMMDMHRIQQQQQQQQQQQRMAMMPAGAGHMAASFRQPMPHGPQHVGPMQANPPMPMQQVMQQQQRQMAAPGYPPGMAQMAPPPQQQQPPLFIRSHQPMYVQSHAPRPMYPGMQSRHPGYHGFQ